MTQRIQELMTRDVQHVAETATLADAIKVMQERNCGIVPVVADDQRKLAGVLTDRDVALSAFSEGRALSQIPVSRCMSRKLHTITEDTGIEQAEQSMREHQVRRLPVVDGEQRLVGMLSLGDLARASNGGSEKKPLTESLGKTLGRISEPQRS